VPELDSGGRCEDRDRGQCEDSRDRLTWTWGKGAAIALEELGDPTTTTRYVLCGSVGSTLAFELDTEPGETCYRGPSWVARRDGFRYRCPAGGSSGVTRLLVTAGPAGTSRALVKARGAKIPLPSLPIATPLRVDLRSDTGLCVEGIFSTPSRNDARRFVAHSSASVGASSRDGRKEWSHGSSAGSDPRNR
jgi:hypothetical protein